MHELIKATFGQPCRKEELSFKRSLGPPVPSVDEDRCAIGGRALTGLHLDPAVAYSQPDVPLHTRLVILRGAGALGATARATSRRCRSTPGTAASALARACAVLVQRTAALGFGLDEGHSA